MNPDLPTINRCAIIVRAQAPFLAWLHSLEESNRDLTLEDLNDEASVYLLNEVDDMREAEKRLRANFAAIFDEQLSGWYTDPSVWPKPRDFRLFQKWFTWTFHSMIFDLSRQPLEREMIQPE
jgi:hypothetical protein